MAYRWRGPTCRCPMCGSKNASRKNKGRGAFIRSGIGRDEHDKDWDGRSKKEQRQLLRTREKRQFRDELEE